MTAFSRKAILGIQQCLRHGNRQPTNKLYLSNARCMIFQDVLTAYMLNRSFLYNDNTSQYTDTFMLVHQISLQVLVYLYSYNMFTKIIIHKMIVQYEIQLKTIAKPL